MLARVVHEERSRERETIGVQLDTLRERPGEVLARLALVAAHGRGLQRGEYRGMADAN